MEKIEIILQFKKEDFFETKYGRGKDCAITRALARGGNPDLIDAGCSICMKEASFDDVVFDSDESYAALRTVVACMYLSAQKDLYTEAGFGMEIVPIIPKDFVTTLKVDRWKD